MKKTIIALAVSGLAVASVAQAAPKANTFYVGAKAGWTNFHNDINQFNSKYATDSRFNTVNVKGQDGFKGYSVNRHAVTYGVFGGYQIIDNLALEIGYDDLGRVRLSEKNAKDESVVIFKHSAHGAHLSLKPSVEVAKGLDLFAKVSAVLVRNDYKNYNLDGSQADKYHTLRTSLGVGGGVEYAILPELSLRTEYQWLRRVGNFEKAVQKANGTTNVKYSPDSHSVSLGLVYRFGQGSDPVAVAAPEVINKSFAFNSDVLFAFGKADLALSGQQVLDSVNDEISKLGINSPSVQVSGYTDRIGSEAANLKLSQRRAETVANYIVSKGVNPANVTAVGYGEANPVTGHTCDTVKGRKALIACLAPDRRVELQVQGEKQITM
ncbi:OOP family OmpA-OmpF porin [Nicoletella semolina]|uniref:Outer membrane protein A n=1 Tax=Nicoletella semolina TaxID=271160 RepID=A0A4V2SJY6_9PAST|nr:porin OmpA [Nicoletella semolina]MDH2924516.1 hypothetical protein [Nicoletella semolina]TCP17356.1 OOP family OmpA-OmpF porin [Nicoletella semolina]